MQNTLFDTVKHTIGKGVVEMEHGSVRYSAELSHTFEIDDVLCDKTELVREIVSFLQRTHSLRNPHCTCRPAMSKSRILDYGLNPTKQYMQQEMCCLSKTKSKIYTQHIENEILIPNIENACLQGQSILSLLHQSSLFSQDADQTWKLGDAAKVCDSVTLLSHVRKSKRGVAIDDIEIQYPKLIEDVYKLNAQQQIFILKTNNRIYYNTIQQRKCDEDIVMLWTNAKSNTS